MLALIIVVIVVVVNKRSTAPGKRVYETRATGNVQFARNTGVSVRRRVPVLRETRRL